MNIGTLDSQNVTVSVVMPAHNSERFIEAAINSVIVQTHSKWELIIIDDASTDNTGKIIEQMALKDKRIKFIRNTVNTGPAQARNSGIDMSVGEYIAFLDSDDVWHCDKLEKQIKKIILENADLVYTSYAIIDGNGAPCRKDYVIPAETSFDMLLKENVIGCSTVMLTRNMVDKYRFVSDFYLEDYCLWLDILNDGNKAVGCEEVLVDWRLIANSRSFNKMNNAKKRWKIYREYLNLSFFKSLNLFIRYTVNGIKKYYI